jgi:hypothetical protein
VTHKIILEIKFDFTGFVMRFTLDVGEPQRRAIASCASLTALPIAKMP